MDGRAQGRGRSGGTAGFSRRDAVAGGCDGEKGASPRAAGVLCIGAVMVDVLCRVPSLPARGEGVVTTARVTRLGGCAFNSGAVVRQMGAPCFLLAPVGRGLYADYVRGELAARGLEALEVDVSLDNGACLCLVEPDGERTMVTSPGVERHFERAWFDGVDVSAFGAAVASGYEIEGAGGEAIISFLEDHPSLEFYYAPGPRIVGVGAGKHARINALRPVWHLNDLEALQFTGAHTVDEAGRAIAQMCGNACVVTQGAEGATMYGAAGERLRVAARPVSVVDTVGAGDAHVGALAAARAAGLSWERSLELANGAAGVACETLGGAVPDGALGKAGLSLRAPR